MSETRSYDETDAFICAAKGEPYTQAEWERKVLRLERELEDARRRNAIALREGVCLPARYDRGVSAWTHDE